MQLGIRFWYGRKEDWLGEEKEFGGEGGITLQRGKIEKSELGQVKLSEAGIK